ncbi:MAG: hypothetical protein KC456_05415 [Flavobacteriales bacterium]|nr:hypothetical protein [Flavobacteriales bacterium]
MKQLQNILAAICVMLVFTQCDPYEVPAPAGAVDPVFYVRGELDGNDINWESDGNTFLASGSVSDYWNNVYGYGSQMTNVECEDIGGCVPSIKLEVRGNNEFNAAVTPQPYPFRFYNGPDSMDVYTITIHPEARGELEGCEWIINSSETLTTQGSDPLVLKRDQNDDSFFTLKLISSHIGGCTSEIEDIIYLPHHGCRAEIAVTELDAPNHLLFDAKATGNFGFKYDWTFESGPMASSQEVEYRINEIPMDGIETVLLEIESAGCSARRVRNQVVDSSALCNINFNYEVETAVFTSPETEPSDLGTVTVVYQDEMNNVYRSQIIEQPDWSSYNIIEVGDNYIDPLSGSVSQHTVIQTEFSVLLSNEKMGTIELRNCQAILPIR